MITQKFLWKAKAHDINIEIVRNKQCYVDLLARLKAAEVEREKEQHRYFCERLQAWRSLRRTHALEMFKAKMDTPGRPYVPRDTTVFVSQRNRCYIPSRAEKCDS